MQSLEVGSFLGQLNAHNNHKNISEAKPSPLCTTLGGFDTSKEYSIFYEKSSTLVYIFHWFFIKYIPPLYRISIQISFWIKYLSIKTVFFQRKNICIHKKCKLSSLTGPNLPTAIFPNWCQVFEKNRTWYFFKIPMPMHGYFIFLAQHLPYIKITLYST